MPNHRVAIPRKAKKPVQSVTVVTKTEEAIAGSAPILSSSSGRRDAGKGCRYQIDDHRRRNHPAQLVVVEPVPAIAPMIVAKTMPFRMPTPASCG